MRLIAGSILILIVFLCGMLPSLGSCVSGKAATYDDISAVMFERRGCGGLGGPPKNPPLRCSNYYLSLWDVKDPAAGQTYREDQTYAQYSSRSDRGTWHVDLTLKDAINLLEMNQFFLLNPGEDIATDIRDTVITVRRCGVVTRLMMQPLPDFDPKVNLLFSQFDTLVENAKKHKVSDNPQDFKYTLLFEGQ